MMQDPYLFQKVGSGQRIRYELDGRTLDNVVEAIDESHILFQDGTQAGIEDIGGVSIYQNLHVIGRSKNVEVFIELPPGPVDVSYDNNYWINKGKALFNKGVYAVILENGEPVYVDCMEFSSMNQRWELESKVAHFIDAGLYVLKEKEIDWLRKFYDDLSILVGTMILTHGIDTGVAESKNPIGIYIFIPDDPKVQKLIISSMPFYSLEMAEKHYGLHFKAYVSIDIGEKKLFIGESKPHDGHEYVEIYFR